MPDSPQASGAARPAEPVSEAPEAIAPAPEPKLPSRKDASLKEFLGKMDDYAPIVCFAFPYVSLFLATPDSILTSAQPVILKRRSSFTALLYINSHPFIRCFGILPCKF